MRKIIAVYKTNSARVINLPIKMVEQLGIENDKYVSIELDGDKLIIKKMGGEK